MRLPCKPSAPRATAGGSLPPRPCGAESSTKNGGHAPGGLVVRRKNDAKAKERSHMVRHDGPRWLHAVTPGQNSDRRTPSHSADYTSAATMRTGRIRGRLGTTKTARPNRPVQGREDAMRHARPQALSDKLTQGRRQKRLYLQPPGYFPQLPGLNPGCGLACCPGEQSGGPWAANVVTAGPNVAVSNAIAATKATSLRIGSSFPCGDS
jgi:hypothetical protein